MYFIRYFGVILTLAIGFVVATGFLVVNLGLPILRLAADRVTVTYEVTATVRVNGELRSGSSLQQGIISRNDFFGSQRLNTTTRILGEAVAVPITDHNYLLFTLHTVPGNRSYEGVMTSPCRDIFAYSGSERPTADAILANAANFTGPCDLSPDRVPLMLAVTNSSEPVGFQVATPSTLADVFGRPVEFVSLSFRRTEDPLRFDLDKVFPWLKTALGRKVNMPVPLKPNGQLSSFYISYISTGSGE
ncbi:hypothetical protein [Devosia salina]|uniref:DUF3108 domain-containing protein n=1 Tax=Devosia salina TaxID=2860336 RepID=A0ABX8WFM2_9HYPH|nr:hypothetical protein [Devosia salina]QYO76995.1 hypothetical protein K1X15_20955 [Devosia salina]